MPGERRARATWTGGGVEARCPRLAIAARRAPVLLLPVLLLPVLLLLPAIFGSAVASADPVSLTAMRFAVPAGAPTLPGSTPPDTPAGTPGPTARPPTSA